MLTGSRPGTAATSTAQLKVRDHFARTAATTKQRGAARADASMRRRDPPTAPRLICLGGQAGASVALRPSSNRTWRSLKFPRCYFTAASLTTRLPCHFLDREGRFRGDLCRATGGTTTNGTSRSRGVRASGVISPPLLSRCGHVIRIVEQQARAPRPTPSSP